MRCPTEAHRQNELGRRPKSTSRGDIAAGWYREFSKPLLCYLVNLTRSIHEAQDIAQEAFLHVLSVSEPLLNPKAFLFTTALNLLRDHYRRAHTHAMLAAVPVEEAEILDFCEPSQVIESEQALAQLVDTLGQLRPPTRKAFLLGRLELRSNAQIASRMGITVSMVEKHVKYAMDAFETIGLEQPRHVGGRCREVMAGRARRAKSWTDEGRTDRRAPTMRGRKTEGSGRRGIQRPMRLPAMLKSGAAVGNYLRGYTGAPVGFSGG